MKTGFNDLDNVIEIKNGDLIVVASRPAMGKSTFVQNILSNVAIKENKSILFFSLEESKEMLINKLIISNSKIKADKFGLYNEYKKNGKLKPDLSDEDWDRITYGINLLKDAPIYIASDTPYTIEDICAKSSNFKKEKDIGIIIIDYLQLIQFDKSRLLSRDNEITEILRELKVLSKVLDVPIIVTSQLSRKCEKREDKRPIIEDFTNSKYGITTYCDKILFLYRDSYYNKANKNEITEIIVAKSNDGQIGTIKIDWIQEYYTFRNIIVYEEEEDEK